MRPGSVARSPDEWERDDPPHSTEVGLDSATGTNPSLAAVQGVLPEEEELPDQDQDEAYNSNPLWTCLAEALSYKLLFARRKHGN